ncbi:hypothetical protein [Variovorax sp.]|uniref:hypothetical protein n=1 Tax=Variovorax sp. TaxID=1871043 RepID=UPI003BAB757D
MSSVDKGGLVEPARLYLLDLAMSQLPREVVTSPDLRHVCVLAATGLITARMNPPFDLHGRNGELEGAWVLSITLEGWEEIERIRLDIKNQRVASRSIIRQHRTMARLGASGAGNEVRCNALPSDLFFNIDRSL